MNADAKDRAARAQSGGHPAPPWPAPSAGAPLDATVRLPGSKSITNRALLLAAIADAPSTVWHPLRARDTELMVTALRALGVDVVDVADPATRAPIAWQVTPRPLRAATIDVGNAGTVMRFVPPVAALATGAVAFRGDPRASERPIGAVLEALRAMGVRVDGDRVPFTLHGAGRVRGGRVVIDASSSSQFVSALLLAGARYAEGVEVVHDGPPVPSQPHIDMTVAMLADAGIAVDTSVPDRWAVAPSPVVARDVHVEPDLSNAAPFLAAAMVTGGTVRIPGWPRATTQAGDALRVLFSRMGATVGFDGDDLVLTGPPAGGLRGLDTDLHDVGELAPVLAAVCALAATPSELRGIAHLRLHETDRLAALAAELGAMGAGVTELADGLRIDPAPLHGTTFHTYEDHRLATAAAVLGLVVPGVLVENVATTDKTLPGFVDLWRHTIDGSRTAPGATTARPEGEDAAMTTPTDAPPLRVIAIDGPAGSGKSTVARAVAARLGLEYLDTGAMYRAVAFAAISQGIEPDDVDRVADIAERARIEVDERGVRVDGVDATIEIRGPEVTRAVSAVAANPKVRAALRDQQRAWARRRGGGVLEGRDIGTVVFPDASLKVYLTADPEVRAARRTKEVRDLSYETVAEDIARRDALDSARTHDPLAEAADAVHVDTSRLTIDGVVDRILELLP